MSAGERLARGVYRALLRCYPAAFRRAYADELLLLFGELRREARGRGPGAQLRLWAHLLPDLLASATRERGRAMTKAHVATGFSLLLCLPILLLAISAGAGYEPPVVAYFAPYIIAPDGTTPTTLGRVAMLALLLALPLAFAVNVLAMLLAGDIARTAPFRPTPGHTIAGLAILVAVLLALFGQVRHELRPFVAELGRGAGVGQAVVFLGLLALPVAFLLGWWPRWAARAGAGFPLRPTSLNLIIGATILLVILAIGGSFALEGVACASGVPNCD